MQGQLVGQWVVELQSAWRRRISQVHPDRGGNVVVAAAVNASYVTLAGQGSDWKPIDLAMQLTAALTQLLTKYLNNPDVNVFVTEVRSKKFYIDGEMNRPGSFALVTPTSVLEALSRGGGFREFANTRKIRVLRGGEVRRFNYKEVTRGKHLEQNIAVENGDHIIVP